jgi:hypothetical protein
VSGEQHADTIRADHADAIREAITRLIWQDRLEVPHAVKAEAALNALLAENQRLRDALEAFFAEFDEGKEWSYYAPTDNTERLMREALDGDSEEET